MRGFSNLEILLFLIRASGTECTRGMYELWKQNTRIRNPKPEK